MNAFDERPGGSDLNKILLVVAVAWAYAILIGSFWWIMTAIRESGAGLPAAMGATAAYALLVMVIALVGRRAWRRTSGDPTTPALDRRNRRTMAAGVVYTALLLAVVWLQRLHPVHGPLAYALAVLPAIPVVGMVVSMGLYFREETDEVERAIRIENALWATGGTLALATVWGFAEMLADAPHVGAWLWFPVWAVFGSVSDFFIRRRYR